MSASEVALTPIVALKRKAGSAGGRHSRLSESILPL
jgi:hypothetical protein